MLLTVNTCKILSPIVLCVTRSNIHANKYEKCSKAIYRAPELGLLQKLLEPCDDKITNVSCARSIYDNQDVFIEIQGRSRLPRARFPTSLLKSFAAHMKNHLVQVTHRKHSVDCMTRLIGVFARRSFHYFTFVISHSFYFMDKLLSFVQQLHCTVVPGVLSYKR